MGFSLIAINDDKWVPPFMETRKKSQIWVICSSHPIQILRDVFQIQLVPEHLLEMV
jgi:hypothetical protein